MFPMQKFSSISILSNIIKVQMTYLIWNHKITSFLLWKKGLVDYK